MNIDLEKILPNNLEVERLVIGYTLVSGRLELDLEPEDFYLDSHRKIWKMIQAMSERGENPDLVTVLHALRSSNEIEICGGSAYLASLTEGVATFHEALSSQYCDIIREQRALRTGIQVGNELMARGYAAEEPFRDIVNDAFSRLDSELGRIDRKSGPRPLSEIVSETFKTIEDISNRKETDGFKTGFVDFDRIVHRGFQRKEMAVIAGRPGHGKTSMVLNMACKMGKIGINQVIYSLEMAEQQIVLRMIAYVGRVELTRMATGFLNKEDWNRISVASGELSQMPIWIDDSSSITVADIRSRTRRIIKPIGVVWIDYLQLITAPRHLANRPDVEKIGSISMSLKNMAKGMDIALVAAAQLSREAERRKDSLPKISDLRQSGQIEQDADLVALLYRDEIVKASDDNRGLAQVIIGKQRNGPTGSIQMAFDGRYSCFDALYQEDRPPGDDRWYDR